MNEPITDPYHKLPLTKVLAGAFLMPWWYRASFARALMYPVALLTILMLLWHYLGSEWHQLIQFGLYGIYGLLFTVLAVTSHRLIILGPDSVPTYGLKRLSIREWRFIGWILGAYLGYLVVWMVPMGALATIGSMMFGNSSDIGTAPLVEWMQWTSMLAALPSLYVIGRWSLIFPATAIDLQMDLKWSWRRTKGNGLRMMVVVGLLPWLLSVLTGILWRENATIIETTLLTLVGFSMTVVQITALSLSYNELATDKE